MRVVLTGSVCVLATGKIQSLWINFARYYENPKSHHRLRGEGEEEETQLGTAEDDEEAPDPDLEAATMIFEKATGKQRGLVPSMLDFNCEYIQRRSINLLMTLHHCGVHTWNLNYATRITSKYDLLLSFCSFFFFFFCLTSFAL